MKALIFNNWKHILDNSENADFDSFVSKIHSKNLRNSVFVDVTATERWQQLMTKYFQEVFQLLPVIKLPVPHLTIIIKS